MLEFPAFNPPPQVQPPKISSLPDASQKCYLPTACMPLQTRQGKEGWPANPEVTPVTMISKIQTLFTCLITLQFVVVALHDLLDIPGWTHGSQVRSIVGRRKLWLITLANSIFPGVAVAFAIYFWNKPKPELVADYWLIYCAVTLASAIAMWYVPYLLGTTEERKRDYSRMYAGTRQVLPPRGDNPRPNLLHVCFHGLFVINFFLALVLCFRSV